MLRKKAKTEMRGKYCCSLGTALSFSSMSNLASSVVNCSVAERVAWERGEAVGKSVGYVIRLDNAPPRAHGSILYCTTGILLRRLQVWNSFCQFIGELHVLKVF